MTLIKRSTFGSLPSIFDDIFDRDFVDRANYPGVGSTMPSVNIRESEKEFNIEVAAPGMERNDFKIELDDNVLSISAEKELKTSGDEKYTRQEFSYHSFRRTFTLPKTVDADKINANYKDGLLIVKVPKIRDEGRSAIRKINIK